MLRGVQCRKCLILTAGAATLTLIVIVVGIVHTRTAFDIYGRSTVFEKSVTTVTTSTRQTVAVSDVTTFRGRLIKSSDQLGNDSLNSSRCIKTKISGLAFPICVYGATEDVYVSNTFIVGGYYERRFVERFIRLLRRYPDIQFVDLGANIGTFTLPAARITDVLAVEPYTKSMARLFKSIQLGGVEKNVSLVFNAISNERATSKLGFYPRNIGGTFLSAVHTTNCAGVSCTQTILLDDLLPLMRRRRAVMKVDIERHQPRVFTNSTASRFFQMIDVPLIFMEWNLCQQQYISSEVRKLIHFFAAHQYRVFSENDHLLERKSCRHWSGNIILTKQSLNF